jgi:ketosteroid isomerase-like protein
MKTYLFRAGLLLAVLASFAATMNSQTTSKQAKSNYTRDRAQIRAVMDAQAAAWNRGDIAGYMDGYWRSSKTTFVSGDSITRGWQTVLDRYQKRYDSRAKMGTPTFSELEIQVLSPTAAVVLGKWELQRDQDHPRGYFTLIFRKVKAGWRIVQDHTSSAS